MNDSSNCGSTFAKPPGEHELIEAVGTGDIDAFEILIRKYRNSVLNFIFKFTGDKFGAEDIAQEVFLKVYLGASRFKPVGKVSTWIFKIAYNLSMNELLRRSRFSRVCGLDELESEPAEPNGASLKELSQEVMEAVGRLPEKQRAALLLRVNEDLSYAEIGNVLSSSVAGVESLLFRARENLKKMLIDAS
jgi:RNA polymerase sigma-70 factor (ECF subfamily)